MAGSCLLPTSLAVGSRKRDSNWLSYAHAQFSCFPLRRLGTTGHGLADTLPKHCETAGVVGASSLTFGDTPGCSAGAPGQRGRNLGASCFYSVPFCSERVLPGAGLWTVSPRACITPYVQRHPVRASPRACVTLYVQRHPVRAASACTCVTPYMQRHAAL